MVGQTPKEHNFDKIIAAKERILKRTKGSNKQYSCVCVCWFVGGRVLRDAGQTSARGRRKIGWKKAFEFASCSYCLTPGLYRSQQES